MARTAQGALKALPRRHAERDKDMTEVLNAEMDEKSNLLK